MFLKLLEKLGRKKIVLDRGPSHLKFNEAKPWMNRYYVLLRHRPKWFPFNILLHEMLAGYIGFRSSNTLHRVDLKRDTTPLTIFISGPFGLRKGPRSEYGVDFKKKYEP